MLAADARGSAELPDQPNAPLTAVPADHPVEHESRRRADCTGTRLPVPRPLPAAIMKGRFGREEDSRPVPPGRNEVRAITEQHAGKLAGLLESIASSPMTGKVQLLESFQSALDAYTEDFGEAAADCLEAYVRRQRAHGGAARARGR